MRRAQKEKEPPRSTPIENPVKFVQSFNSRTHVIEQKLRKFVKEQQEDIPHIRLPRFSEVSYEPGNDSLFGSDSEPEVEREPVTLKTDKSSGLDMHRVRQTKKLLDDRRRYFDGLSRKESGELSMRKPSFLNLRTEEERGSSAVSDKRSISMSDLDNMSTVATIGSSITRLNPRRRMSQFDITSIHEDSDLELESARTVSSTGYRDGDEMSVLNDWEDREVDVTQSRRRDESKVKGLKTKVRKPVKSRSRRTRQRQPRQYDLEPEERLSWMMAPSSNFSNEAINGDVKNDEEEMSSDLEAAVKAKAEHHKALMGFELEEELDRRRRSSQTLQARSRLIRSRLKDIPEPVYDLEKLVQLRKEMSEMKPVDVELPPRGLKKGIGATPRPPPGRRHPSPEKKKSATDPNDPYATWGQASALPTPPGSQAELVAKGPGRRHPSPDWRKLPSGFRISDSLVAASRRDAEILEASWGNTGAPTDGQRDENVAKLAPLLRYYGRKNMAVPEFITETSDPIRPPGRRHSSTLGSFSRETSGPLKNDEKKPMGFGPRTSRSPADSVQGNSDAPRPGRRHPDNLNKDDGLAPRTSAYAARLREAREAAVASRRNSDTIPRPDTPRPPRRSSNDIPRPSVSRDNKSTEIVQTSSSNQTNVQQQGRSRVQGFLTQDQARKDPKIAFSDVRPETPEVSVLLHARKSGESSSETESEDEANKSKKKPDARNKLRRINSKKPLVAGPMTELEYSMERTSMKMTKQEDSNSLGHLQTPRGPTQSSVREFRTSPNTPTSFPQVVNIPPYLRKPTKMEALMIQGGLDSGREYSREEEAKYRSQFMSFDFGPRTGYPPIAYPGHDDPNLSKSEHVKNMLHYLISEEHDPTYRTYSNDPRFLDLLEALEPALEVPKVTRKESEHADILRPVSAGTSFKVPKNATEEIVEVEFDVEQTTRALSKPSLIL